MSVKISQLPNAGSLTGTELVPIVQGGVTSHTTTSALGASSSTYTPPFANSVTTTVTSKLSQTISVFDFMTSAQIADVQAGTASIDCYDSIMAAINSQTYGTGWYISGPDIIFPPGVYLVNTTIQLKKFVKFFGTGSGTSISPSTTLKFPSGTTGIIIHSYNTIGNTTQTTPTTAGVGFILDGFILQGTSGTPDSYGGHGVWFRGRGKITNCIVQGFAGDGIHILASAGSGGATEGNSNGWAIEYSSTRLNGGNGLYVKGADVNAGCCTALDTNYNGLWGIYDSSFLGNTYVACQAAENTGGSYKSDDPNARNLFLNCYSEGGQPSGVVNTPSIVIGGLHGAGMIANSILVSSLAGLVAGNTSFATGSNASGYNIIMGSAGTDDTLSVITADSTPVWRLKGYPGRMAWDVLNFGGSEYSQLFNGGAATAASGYQRDLNSSVSNIYGIYVDNPPGMPLGYFDAGMRARVTMSAIPTVGQWLLGDIIYNPAPTAGGYLGWVCTTASALTIGSISSGSSTLTVVNGSAIVNGDHINIAGAGPSGAAGQDLYTTVVSGGGTTTITLANTATRTLSSTASTTGSITSGSNSLDVASGVGIVNGSTITVTGAGVSGANLVTTVTVGGGGSILTLAAAASTTVSNVAVSVTNTGGIVTTPGVWKTFGAISA